MVSLFCVWGGYLYLCAVRLGITRSVLGCLLSIVLKGGSNRYFISTGTYILHLYILYFISIGPYSSLPVPKGGL